MKTMLKCVAMRGVSALVRTRVSILSPTNFKILLLDDLMKTIFSPTLRRLPLNHISATRVADEKPLIFFDSGKH